MPSSSKTSEARVARARPPAGPRARPGLRLSSTQPPSVDGDPIRLSTIGKLKIRLRSERCAPSVFVALTGAASGTGRARAGPLRRVRLRQVDAAKRAEQSAPTSVVGTTRDRPNATRPGRLRRQPRRTAQGSTGRVVRLHGRLRDASGRARSERARAGRRARRAVPRGAAAGAEPAAPRGSRGRGRRARVERSGSRRPTRRPVRSAARRRAPREGRGAAGGGDHGAGPGSPVSNGVPEPDPGDRKADMLLRRDRRRCEQRERPEGSLVEVPPREEEQRARERDGMEVAQVSHCTGG